MLVQLSGAGQHGQAVVRPGLVIGPGGLFAENQKAILRSPFLILPEVDLSSVYYVALEDLLESMMKILEQRLVGAFNLFCETPVSLRDFVGAISRSGGRTVPLISIPADPLFRVIDLMRWMQIPFPSVVSRLAVMHQNMKAPIHVADIRQFVRKQILIDDAVKARKK